MNNKENGRSGNIFWLSFIAPQMWAKQVEGGSLPEETDESSGKFTASGKKLKRKPKLYLL